MISSPSRHLTRAAYHAQHAGIRLPLFAMQQVVRMIADRRSAPGGREEALVEDRYFKLLRHDLENAEQGYYPPELLFGMPMRDYAKTLPRLLLELPRVIRRAQSGRWNDLPKEVDLKRYPAYFRRTFHWQTDGYLSRRSAELYDLGVEVVFLGSGDVMRRQIIPPIVRHLKLRKEEKPARFLDVACGTGRSLLLQVLAHPDSAGHKYYGLDLSPYYLQVAQELFADRPEVSFVNDNAETMPFKDAHFDVLTSVFLFHELPSNARRRVFAEMFRVLAPGGILVIEDSAQLAESKDLEFFLERFADDLHEPFYRDYIRDDLAVGLKDAGFRIQSVEPCFMAKVLVATKPA